MNVSSMNAQLFSLNLLFAHREKYRTKHVIVNQLEQCKVTLDKKFLRVLMDLW